MASLFPSNRFPIASGRAGRSSAVGEKRLVTETSFGSATRAWGSVLLRPRVYWWRRQAPRRRRSAGAARRPPHRSGFRKREHIERPSGCGPSSLRSAITPIMAERAGRIARVKVAGRTTAARPSRLPPDRIGDIFVAVRPAIGHRLADDPGAGLELPLEFTCLGVDGFEPARPWSP